jgi:HEAT repeat protein
MNHWKIHLAWAVATPIFAFCWGRWSLARQEPDFRRREHASENRTREQQTRPSAPSPAAVPASIPKTVAAPVAGEPVSEEQAFVDEIRRLFRSDDKSDLWEAARRLGRIPKGPLLNELLLDQLACKEHHLRYEAINSLADSMKADFVPLLLGILKTDDTGSNRRFAAQYLGTYGGPGAMEALLQACQDPDLTVQIAAANSLNHLGQPGPAEALVPRFAKGLESPDGGVRRDAVDDISSLTLDSALPLLLRSFRDPDGDVRDSASRGVSLLDAPGLLPMLEGLLKDPDPKVVEAAGSAIARYKLRYRK